MNTLFNMHWYKQHIQGKHEVMIGYSDSAKDAGFMSANWAQYRAQEELTAIAQTHGVQLTLFHGRGGSLAVVAHQPNKLYSHSRLVRFLVQFGSLNKGK